MFELRVKGHFDAAHMLADYKGKCSRLHGHRWDVEIMLKRDNLDEINMLVDFKIVKSELNEVLERLDHYSINDVLDTVNPTAEYIARWIYNELQKTLCVSSVIVWESPDCSVSYFVPPY